MQYVINGYQPESVFHYFEEISAIPRGSGNEKALASYLEAFAQEQGLFCYRDEVDNIVIKKAGSKGCEQLPGVMLQGHLDMVCEKNADTAHDFEKDGIKLYVEDDILRARGTTLGADNGVAVVYMMGLLADKTLRHPPLECVFTAQEEIGLIGASHLDGGVITAKTLINLDSEDEGVATISCAGGMRVRFYKPIERENVPDACGVSVSVRGLKGGHSGGDIHQERGNANKLMARLLYRVMQETDMRLVSINGGSKDNAIPRECDSLLAFGTSAQAAHAVEMLRAAQADLRDEFAMSDAGVTVRAETTALTQPPMTHNVTEELVKLMYLAPNGAKSRNVSAGGFIVCSVNMGVVETGSEKVKITFSPRSSIASLQQETKSELRLLGELFGFEVNVDSEYPGWGYVESSPIREQFCAAYREMFGKELKCEAIHAGLECGLFLEKLPGLDAIALGPQVRNAHTPDELLELRSAERIWKLLVNVLERLCQA